MSVNSTGGEFCARESTAVENTAISHHKTLEK
jgi:hypothetical protein